VGARLHGSLQQTQHQHPPPQHVQQHEDGGQQVVWPAWPPWRYPGWEEVKTCVLLSTAYFFMFVAYGSSQNLASTLPIPPPASGNMAMAIVYGVFVFSSFWSPLFVDRVGAKGCVQGAFLMYGTYIAANMLPRTYTLYPGAAAVGLAASPLWVAQGILITHSAHVYSAKRGEADLSANVGLFNGIFGAAMLLTGVAGNLIAGAAFSQDCGAAAAQHARGGGTGYHGPVHGGGGPKPPPPDIPQAVVIALFSVYLCSTGCAVAVASCALPTVSQVDAQRVEWALDRAAAGGAEGSAKRKRPDLWTTVNMMRQPRMYLLGPIYMANGLVSALVSAVFTKVSKTPRRPRSWTNFTFYGCIPSLHLVGQPNTFLALGRDPAQPRGVQRGLRHGRELSRLRARQRLDRPDVGPFRPARGHGPRGRLDPRGAGCPALGAAGSP
jgi:MFS family permease